MRLFLKSRNVLSEEVTLSMARPGNLWGDVEETRRETPDDNGNKKFQFNAKQKTKVLLSTLCSKRHSCYIQYDSP